MVAWQTNPLIKLASIQRLRILILISFSDLKDLGFKNSAGTHPICKTVQDVLLFPLSTFYEYLQKVYYKNVWICQSVQWEVLRNVSSRRWTKNKNKHSLLLWVMICLHRQVDKDCELLEQERIMDYSLLVGIHFKDRCKGKLHYACFYVLAPAKML